MTLEDFTQRIELLQHMVEIEERIRILGDDSIAAMGLKILRDELAGSLEISPRTKRKPPVSLQQELPIPQEVVRLVEDVPARPNGRPPLASSERWSAEQIRQEALRFALANNGNLILRDFNANVSSQGGEPGHYVAGQIQYAGRKLGIFALVSKGRYKLTPAGKKAAERVMSGGPAQPLRRAHRSREEQSEPLTAAQMENTGKPDGITNMEWMRREIYDWAKRHHGQVNLEDFRRHWTAKYPKSPDLNKMGFHQILKDGVKKKLMTRTGEGEYQTVKEHADAASA